MFSENVTYGSKKTRKNFNLLTFQKEFYCCKKFLIEWSFGTYFFQLKFYTSKCLKLTTG